MRRGAAQPLALAGFAGAHYAQRLAPSCEISWCWSAQRDPRMAAPLLSLRTLKPWIYYARRAGRHRTAVRRLDRRARKTLPITVLPGGVASFSRTIALLKISAFATLSSFSAKLRAQGNTGCSCASVTPCGILQGLSARPLRLYCIIFTNFLRGAAAQRQVPQAPEIAARSAAAE